MHKICPIDRGHNKQFLILCDVRVTSRLRLYIEFSCSPVGHCVCETASVCVCVSVCGVKCFITAAVARRTDDFLFVC